MAAAELHIHGSSVCFWMQQVNEAQTKRLNAQYSTLVGIVWGSEATE